MEWDECLCCASEYVLVSAQVKMPTNVNGLLLTGTTLAELKWAEGARAAQ